MEGELIWKSLSRRESHCKSIENTKSSTESTRVCYSIVILRDNDDENELTILKFIHTLVETLDKYLDILLQNDEIF